jgi:pyruvate,water dikinase
VVTDPSSDDPLDAEEILVCDTTDPSWVSLFVSAAALVIDIGGPLSHGAIVARELGIPAVVNTADGTRAIRTGDRIRVDGKDGRIEILARAEPVEVAA